MVVVVVVVIVVVAVEAEVVIGELVVLVEVKTYAGILF